MSVNVTLDFMEFTDKHMLVADQSSHAENIASRSFAQC